MNYIFQKYLRLLSKYFVKVNALFVMSFYQLIDCQNNVRICHFVTRGQKLNARNDWLHQGGVQGRHLGKVGLDGRGDQVEGRTEA